MNRPLEFDDITDERVKAAEEAWLHACGNGRQNDAMREALHTLCERRKTERRKPEPYFGGWHEHVVASGKTPDWLFNQGVSGSGLHQQTQPKAAVETCGGGVEHEWEAWTQFVHPAKPFWKCRKCKTRTESDPTGLAMTGSEGCTGLKDNNKTSPAEVPKPPCRPEEPWIGANRRRYFTWKNAHLDVFNPSYGLWIKERRGSGHSGLAVAAADTRTAPQDKPKTPDGIPEVSEGMRSAGWSVDLERHSSRGEKVENIWKAMYRQWIEEQGK